MVDGPRYFDSHGHLMSEDAEEWSAKLVAAMTRQGVAAASLSGIALLSAHEDRDVIAAYHRHPGRFCPFLCNFDPNDPTAVDYVRHEVTSNPWVGIGELYLDTGESTHMKLRLRNGNLVEHPYAVAEEGADSPVLNAICELAAERLLVVFVHCENPEPLETLAVRHPGTRFLAAHLDYGWSLDDAHRLLATSSNVWADIGPVLKHAFRRGRPAAWAETLVSGWQELMRTFPSRVCLGTDFFSWGDLDPPQHRKYYEAYESLVAALDEPARQSVCGGNFAALLGREASETGPSV